ncbi:unnamed protein product, partial [Didymodactylos carnosus]
TTAEDLAQLDLMLQEHSVGVVSSQTVTPKRHRGLYNELENEEVDENEYSAPGVIMKNNFPLVYVLPKVDPSFETAAATPVLRDFGPRCSKRIYLIKIIHDNIINTYGPDFYPSGVQFDRIGKSVYDKYPSLSNIFGRDMYFIETNVERHNCLSPSTLIEKKREAYGHSNAGRPLKVMKLERTGRKPYLNDENE